MKKSFVRLVRGAVPFMAVAMAVVLSGCQTNNYAGSGPLQLSPGMGDFYQKYLKVQGKAAFAISEDGQCGTYRFCSESTCLERDEKYFAIRNCKDGCKKSCAIFAVRSSIVWQGPVTDANGKRLNP